MSFVHCLLGFPRYRLPSAVRFNTIAATCPAALHTRHKLYIFCYSKETCPVFNLLSTETLVRQYVYLIGCRGTPCRMSGSSVEHSQPCFRDILPPIRSPTSTAAPGFLEPAPRRALDVRLQRWIDPRAISLMDLSLIEIIPSAPARVARWPLLVVRRCVHRARCPPCRRRRRRTVVGARSRFTFSSHCPRHIVRFGAPSNRTKSD